jgi:hypothetical protein
LKNLWLQKAKVILAVILFLIPGEFVHGECVMVKYEIHGSVRDSDGSLAPAVVMFSWEEGPRKTMRHVSVSSAKGAFSAVLYFDPQTKKNDTDVRLYKCDAVLNAVSYQITASNYKTKRGVLKLLGTSTRADFSLQRSDPK